jgi:AraC-like DNA-binding protein
LTRAEKIVEKIKDQLCIGIICQSLGKYYLANKEYLQSIFYYRKVWLFAGREYAESSYLSRIINEKFAINFNNFIKYRINDAKRLLIDKQQHFSIGGITRTAGFNSKSVFNAALKK